MKPQNPGEPWGGPARPLSLPFQKTFLLERRPQSSWESYKILILGGDSRHHHLFWFWCYACVFKVLIQTILL